METIEIIDPETGKAHKVPFEHVEHAMKSGGKFASNEQKQKAMSLSNKSASNQSLSNSGYSYMDYARDIGYGLAKGVRGLGEMLPDMSLNEKFINALGHEKPQINLEGIKPENSSPLGTALQLGSEYLLPIGGAIKAIPKVADRVGGKISKVIGAIQQPAKDVQKSEDLIHGIKNIIEQNKSGIQQAKTKTAEHVNQQLEKSHAEQAKSAEKISEVLPNISERKSNEQLSNVFKKKEEELNQHFEKRYNDFNAEAGHKSIKNPFGTKELLSDIGSIEDVSPSIKKLAQEVSSSGAKRTSAGAKTPAPTRQTTIQNYVRFSRELRDNAYQAFEKAKTDKTLTTVEKEKYRAYGDKLKKLQADTDERIKQSDPKNWKKFKKIQEDWSNQYAPFKPSESGGVFHNAAKEGVINSAGIHKQLSQPSNAHIRAFLTKDPEVRKALLEDALKGASHPLSARSLESQSHRIGDLQNTNPELFDLMTKSQLNALKNHQAVAGKRSAIQDILGKVNSPEFDQILNSFERENLKKFSPDVKAHIESIEKAQAEHGLTSKMLQEAQEAHYGKVKAKKAMQLKKNIAKGIAGIIGLSGAAKSLNYL